MSRRCEAPFESASQSTASPVPTGLPEGRAPRTLGDRKHAAAPLDGDLWVEVTTPRDISSVVAAEWDELALAAGSPNVFYERWNLFTALEHVAHNVHVELVLVYRRGKDSSTKPRLCGLFPLVRDRCARLPMSAWKLFSHPYAYLQTPLMRSGHESPVLAAFVDWAGSLRGGPGILHWSLVDGDGPFTHALADVVNDRGLVNVTIEHRTRALLRRREHWEDAVAAQLSCRHRREMKRQHRRLTELGELTVRTLHRGESLPEWQAAFLQLEQSGWKGESGTALAADPKSREYFLALSTAAHQAGQLGMMGLYLDGRPIALRTYLLAGCDGSYAWKIAYDEEYAKFSPGVQLEIEYVRQFHDDARLQWMDSCATTQHFMINRLWSDRRIVQHVLISLGGRLTNLAVGALPLARAVKRSLQRK